jgi:hypothetical protein
MSRERACSEDGEAEAAGCNHDDRELPYAPEPDERSVSRPRCVLYAGFPGGGHGFIVDTGPVTELSSA